MAARLWGGAERPTGPSRPWETRTGRSFPCRSRPRTPSPAAQRASREERAGVIGAGAGPDRGGDVLHRDRARGDLEGTVAELAEVVLPQHATWPPASQAQVAGSAPACLLGWARHALAYPRL